LSEGAYFGFAMENDQYSIRQPQALS